MEQAAAQLAQDNCELACCFIQKTAVEKAGPEMDKRLATVSTGPLSLKSITCAYIQPDSVSKIQGGVWGFFPRNLSSENMLDKRVVGTVILLC